jgi:DNA replicative helicase MCM subunit Mcm2 (Cdc46/Mcm family)
MIEHFITFEAVILKIYQIKLMPVSFEFSCLDCKASFNHYLVDGNYSQPTRCKGSIKKDCKSKLFLAKKENVKTIFMQRMKVQEIDSEGRTPRQIMCEMRENLVGKVITGETIKLSGVIKTETSDQKDKKTQGIFVPYIIVNSLVQKTQGGS